VESVVADDSEPGMVWGQRRKDVDAEVARGSPWRPLGFRSQPQACSSPTTSGPRNCSSSEESSL